MFTFVKYEIKGTYKYILGIVALVLVLFTGIYTYVNQSDGGSAIGAIFMALSILILFGTALTTFLYIVGSFKKELYEDQGYLTLTLPLSGNQLVGAKLIVALLWVLVLGGTIGLYNFFLMMIFDVAEMSLSSVFSVLGEIITVKSVTTAVLTFLFSGVSLVVTIYFAMALGRVTFKNKRIGGLWFVIFLVLSMLLSAGESGIGELFPYYINLSTFDIGTMEQVIQIGGHIDVKMGIDTAMSTFNIATTLYTIVTIIALFLGTAYLVEKKIDL